MQSAERRERRAREGTRRIHRASEPENATTRAFFFYFSHPSVRPHARTRRFSRPRRDFSKKIRLEMRARIRAGRFITRSGVFAMRVLDLRVDVLREENDEGFFIFIIGSLKIKGE